MEYYSYVQGYTNMKLIDHDREYYLKFQPFADTGIYLKRCGDRYILVGRTKMFKDKLERAGFRFSSEYRAWLMPPRPADAYIYTIVGATLGIPVDMRKYAHLLGRQRSRRLGHMRYDRSVEVNYEQTLIDLLFELKNKLHAEVLPILEKYQTQFQIGGSGGVQYLREILDKVHEIRSAHDFDRIAKTIAVRAMEKADKVNLIRFAKRIKDATGMDITGQIW